MKDEKWEWEKKCGCRMNKTYNVHYEWNGIEQVWCAEHSKEVKKSYLKKTGGAFKP